MLHVPTVAGLARAGVTASSPARLLGVLALCVAVLAAPAAARGAPDGFADLVERVMPAVVTVSTSQRMAGEGGEQAASLGSGFIIDSEGLVVTNNHVVSQADGIVVVMPDGTEHPARLRARDVETDLALLQIEAPGTDFPAVRFGDSAKARVGDWVVAIGGPFGLGGSVSAGIISGQGRNIDSGLYDDFIQTDAAINRGNSGGPLFDMKGRVIGVNTVIFSQTGGSVGVGFAVPGDLAQRVIRQLIDLGETQRGFLGVRLNEVQRSDVKRLSLPSRAGALVEGVTKGGPSARAGLRRDDVIVSFDGDPIAERRDLTRAVADAPVGRTVPLVVLRGGERTALEVTLTRRETALAAAVGAPSAATSGLTLQAATGEVRAAFGIASDVQGVVVTSVDPASPVARAIQPGDVIVNIGWDDVREPADVVAKLKQLREVQSGPVQLLVQRGERLFYETIRP